MTSKTFVFTSEAVSEGHPDKVADQISDAVLDEHIAGDPYCRVACETLVKNDVVILAGEITSGTPVEYERLVRKVVRDIGYEDPKIGFDAETCEVLTFVTEQSQDISMGVDSGTNKEQGAGDQGLMFGFACNETPELMPLPISLSQQLVKELARIRKTRVVDFIKPDSKAQVSVRYSDGKPKEVTTVVVSTQHSEDISLKKLEEFVVETVVKKTVPAKYLNANTKYLINPTGRFVIGGPLGDCGLTGRKIIVDTYGGYSRHGGGAFSGKDPSKVDRSAAYAARHIAKNIVGSGIAAKCEVQVAYAIGVSRPVSIYVDTFGTGKVPDEKISEVIETMFDLRPRSIIEYLNLLKPIYKASASYGHFGREATPQGHFTWEKLDHAEQLKNALL